MLAEAGRADPQQAAPTCEQDLASVAHRPFSLQDSVLVSILSEFLFMFFMCWLSARRWIRKKRSPTGPPFVGRTRPRCSPEPRIL